MPTLLHLDSSARTDSVSRAVTAAFADTWRARGADFRVVRRDLHATPPAHLPDAVLHWPAQLRPSEPPASALAAQRELIDELIEADAVVIGAPMYNYTMPSTLKAWIDHIHVPGVTAPLGDAPQPLAGRTAVIVTSQGAIYDAGTPTAGDDHVLPPLRLVLGTALGMVVETITASRTLAGFIPPMAPEQDRAAEELAAAHARARVLAEAIPVG